MENTNTMGNSTKALPGAGSLVSDTWKLFISTWNVSIKRSSLLIVVGLLYLLGSIMTYVNPSLGILSGILGIVGALATIWITIRIILTMFKLEAGQQVLSSMEETARAKNLFLSVFWVSFLTGLAVFGATLLFIIPGIYFGIALYFGQLITIDQGIKGAQALSASRTLVKGRWWGTFWRLFVGGLVFGIMIGIAYLVVFIPLSFVTNIEALSDGGARASLIAGIVQLIQSIILAALIPFMVGFQVKLYRALQKTR